MKYCKKCGVELDEKMTVCPLCKTSLNEQTENKKEKNIQEDSENNLIDDYESLTKIERRKLFWEISAIILFSAIIITVIIDFMVNKRITWSKYTVTISLVLLVNTSLLTYLRHRFGLLISTSFLSTSTLLVLLDLYRSNIGWGIKLGVPLLFFFYVLIAILALIFRVSNHKGFNIFAFILLAIGFYTIFIEGVVSFYLNENIHFQWSIIVFTCIIPVSAIFLYIHYRLKKGLDLKRVFHI